MQTSPQGWADTPLDADPWMQTHPGCRPLGWADPPGCKPPGLGRPLPSFGQQVGGAHPTGMHTCSKRFVSKVSVYMFYMFTTLNSSCRKVMFSQVCVSHSVHGGRVSLVSGSFLVLGPMPFLG